MHGSSISLLEVCILESSCDVVIFCTLMSKGKNYKAKKKIKFDIGEMRGWS